MRIPLAIRYMIVLTAAEFSRSREDNARESYRARQDVLTVLAGSRITHLVHLCRRVPWATRRLIRLTTLSFTQEA
jgi:hypothetical protein